MEDTDFEGITSHSCKATLLSLEGSMAVSANYKYGGKPFMGLHHRLDLQRGSGGSSTSSQLS